MSHLAPQERQNARVAVRKSSSECSLNLTDCPLFGIGMCDSDCTGKVHKDALVRHVNTDFSLMLAMAETIRSERVRAAKATKTFSDMTDTIFNLRKQLQSASGSSVNKRQRSDVVLYVTQLAEE
eukprot:gene26920-33568_t